MTPGTFRADKRTDRRSSVIAAHPLRSGRAGCAIAVSDTAMPRQDRSFRAHA